MADQAQIKLTADNESLKSSLDESKAMFTEWGVAIKTHIVGMALQLAASIKSAVVDNIKESFAAAAEAEDVLTKLDTKLRAMGDSAQRSREEILDLTDELAKSTRFDDESITRAQTQLLNFSEISGAMFERTQRAAADLAEGMGQDIVSATQMLGRALAYPERGFMMLRQAGINFNEQQRESIKLMLETGNTLGAQSAILTEVEKRYAGAAESGVKTMVGQMDQFKKAIGDLQEDIGNTFLPLLRDHMVPALKSFADVLREDVVPAIHMWMDSLKGVDSSKEIPKWADSAADAMEQWRIDTERWSVKTLLPSEKSQGLLGKQFDEFRKRRLAELDKAQRDLDSARDAMNNKYKADAKREEKEDFDIRKLTPEEVEAQRQLDMSQAMTRGALVRQQRAAELAKRRGAGSFVGTLPVAETPLLDRIGGFLHGMATRERLREMDEAKKGFTSNIDDLIGLNRRISSAAASTSPEVQRLDKLVKQGEEAIENGKKFVGAVLGPLEKIAKKSFGLG